MERTFTILESKREDVAKLVAKYQKKADKYGIPLTVEFGKPYGKKINIEIADEINHCMRVVDTMMVEAFDLTINGEQIRKDGYTVIAKVEHLDGGNIVTAFGTENKQEWSNLDCHCEHCKSNRQRKFTYIVKHTDGSEKQIGSTCLKEYCGIDPLAIGYRNELADILLNDDIDHHDFNSYPVQKVYDPVKVLALAIKIEKAHGYVKSGDPGSNKERLTEEIKGVRLEDNEFAEAEKMASEITALSDEEAREFLLDNVKSILNSTYCKALHFGYMAYAPVACRRRIEELARREELKAKHEAECGSQYIGKEGERISFAVSEVKLLTSFETAYGYTYLYKFVDVLGNVLIWFASRTLDESECKAKVFNATVKSHSERDGVKQTVITRCRIG